MGQLRGFDKLLIAVSIGALVIAVADAIVWLHAIYTKPYRFEFGSYREIWVGDGEIALLARGACAFDFVPFEFILLRSVLTPVVAAVLILANRFELRLREQIRLRAQMKVGCCPACGYDLRASPEICPECGRVA